MRGICKTYLIATLLSLFLDICMAQQQVKTIDVYLLAGQSNATGQGYVVNMDSSMKVNKNVMIFHSGSPHLHTGFPSFTWLPLHPSSESPDRFGPELGLGSRLMELCPKSNIAIIKHAHSGTDLYEQWNPGKNALDSTDWGVQYKVFVKTVEDGLDKLSKQGYIPVIRGMLWQQGENDADMRRPISKDYAKNLKHFIARVRMQFQVPDLLFVYGYVYPPPNKGRGIQDVRRAQRNVSEKAHTKWSVPNAFVIFTDDLSLRADDRNTRYPLDRLHFGTKGTWDLGVRMAEEIAKQNGLH